MNDVQRSAAPNSELIGVVTVLYNSDEVLPGFFESLARQRNVHLRLYVIDNSANDSGCELSRKLAEQFNIDAEIVFNNANVGVAKGNNQGIDLALKDGCSYVLLSNNDIEFESPDLIKNLLDELNGNDISAVVPKIYYYGDGKRIWCAGGEFARVRAITPHFGDGVFDVGQFDGLRKIEYAPTCFMLLKKQVFDQVGKMDESYFVYYDDTDFMWRMRQAGLQLNISPANTIFHKVSHSTGGGESVFSIFYGSRNRIYFIRKHYGFLLKMLAFSFFFSTRLIKYAQFDQMRRAAMLKGIKEGFGLAV